MSFERRVEPELLDTLPGDDPGAMKSRRDLQRVNRLMGTGNAIGDALDPLVKGRRRAQLVELGAGDGTLMLRIAQQRAKDWPTVRLSLIDMQPVVQPDTLTEMRELGWDAQVVGADVFDWFQLPQARDVPIVVANLFVHHFDGDRLQTLINGIAAQARAFVCCEPRRSRFALASSHMVGALGCNAVTRHDAVVSVHAGFRGEELSALWPNKSAWTLQESAAGPFCHRFVAVRKEA